MARGGGTGSRNKKKKAGPETAAAPQNGVTENNIKNNGDHAADKHKNIKHTRKQKVGFLQWNKIKIQFKIQF